MVSTVGSDRSDSARQREAGQTAGATSPETDLSSSVPDTVKTMLVRSVTAVVYVEPDGGKAQVFPVDDIVQKYLIEKGNSEVQLENCQSFTFTAASLEQAAVRKTMKN